jgi:hypothetical protein
MERSVGEGEALRVLDRLLFLIDQAVQLGDRGAAAAVGGDRPRGERLEQRASLEDVRERHVAGAKHQRRRPRRHPLVRLVDDHAAVHAPDHGDEVFRLEDAQRLPQRRSRDAESLHELGLTSQRVALGELAADDHGPELVGDLLRLLPEATLVALAGNHLDHPTSAG